MPSPLIKLRPLPAAANPEPAPPPAPAPAEVDRSLLARLRGEFRLLGEGRSFALPEGYLQKLRLEPSDDGLMCWWEGTGLVLNIRHPAVRRCLPPDSPPRHLYLLLSSVFSVVNRADESVTDVHERQFHQLILETLGTG